MTGTDDANAELDWTAEERAAPRPRIPPWIAWSCGSGCLLFSVAMAVFVFALWRFRRDALDPEKAWAGVAEVLAHDERPAGWTAEGGEMPFVDVALYSLHAPDGGELRVQVFEDGRLVEHALDPDSPQNKGFLDSISVLDPVVGTITLQGREVDCLRFRAKDPSVEGPEGVPTVRVDVTGSGERFVLLEVRSEGPAPIPDERAVELLAPFDLWRGR
jgi:hypothetical protein